LSRTDVKLTVEVLGQTLTREEAEQLHYALGTALGLSSPKPPGPIYRTPKKIPSWDELAPRAPNPVWCHEDQLTLPL
jgi:hypothetical protein